MTVLVTGANGQLGTELRKRSVGSSDRFIFTDVSSLPGVETVYLDITDIDAVRIICKSEGVSLIVNCAAYTNVEKAEEDVDFANLLNHKAPANLAEVAASLGASLIHISTDYVFDGLGCTPVRPDEKPCPVSVYGTTKLAGEIAVQASDCPSIIIRTAWLYSPYGKNFVKTMKALTADKDSIQVVYDQVGSPTYAGDLADAILHIIREGLLDRTGIYHFTDEGAVSWYDFAQEIASQCGNKCDIRPCLSDQFPAKARRPHYSVLDKTSFKETFGFKIPYWKDSLAVCLEKLK